MAGNTEIISILTSGVSFNRFLRPFLISATFLCVLSFVLGNFIIPASNQLRLDFEYEYLKSPYKNRDKDIHMQIEPGTFIYIESYNIQKNIGYKFSIENFDKNELKKKLYSSYIQWDEQKEKWTIYNYIEREIDGLYEEINKGEQKDTVLNLRPKDFNFRLSMVETMNYYELNSFIDKEKMKGSKNLVFHLIEKHKRIAFPFATIILTLVAVAMASRKVKGGIGLHLGLGLLISFSYILFMQISTTFATNGDLSPIIAVWIPNFLFIILAFYLIRKAPK